MKFGLSLEMVNLTTQEPNRNQRESKYYWDELFSLIPAAGFSGIEIPYEPKWDFGGRSGIPFSARSISVKYGGMKNFTDALAGYGIEKIIGVHFDPSLFIGGELDRYFGAFSHYGEEAAAFAGEAGCDTLVITPGPPIGMLRHCGFSGDFLSADFTARTAEAINALVPAAEKSGIKISVKNEFWSVFRGLEIEKLFNRLDGSVLFDADTANLRIAGVEPADFILARAGRIGSAHFTDTSLEDSGSVYAEVNPEFPTGGATQVFRDIGQGKVDLTGAYAALKKADYGGWIVCNNRQTRDVFRAMLRTRRAVNKILSAVEGSV